MNIIEFFVTLPFKIIIAILGFIVWELLSNGEWKWRKRWGTCPVGYWQDQAQWAIHRNQRLEYEHNKHEEELRAYYEQELNKKEREKNYLRSQLHKLR